MRDPGNEVEETTVAVHEINFSLGKCAEVETSHYSGYWHLWTHFTLSCGWNGFPSRLLKLVLLAVGHLGIRMP